MDRIKGILDRKDQKNRHLFRGRWESQVSIALRRNQATLQGSKFPV